MSHYKKQFSILIADYMNYDSAVEIPYLYSRAGCSVTVFSDKDSWLLKNSFYKKNIICNEKNPEFFAEQLQSIIATGNYDRVVLVDDGLIRIMKEVVMNNYVVMNVLPVIKPEHYELLGSKSGLYKFCNQYQFRTPLCVVYNNEPKDVFFEKVRQLIHFPLLLKIDQSQGGRGVFYCKDDLEMISQFELLSDQQKNNLVVQEYISGENIGIEAFFDQGNLTAYVFSRVEKTVGGEFGVSCERTYLPCPKKLELEIIRFGKLFGAHGFASITFIHDIQSDQYFIIEFDSRINAWLRHAKFVGVDFSLAIRASLEHTDIFLRPHFTVKENKKTLWHFPRDLIAAFFDRDWITFAKWLGNNNRRWLMIPWYDWKIIQSIIARSLVFIKKRLP